MIDIHMHCINNVDDGAVDENESLTMLGYANTQGVQKVICTPHSSAFDYDYNKVIHNFKSLRTKVKEESNICIYLGCEIYCSKDNIQAVLKKINNKSYPTMNNTNYVLIEFDTDIPFKDISYICLKLVANNYIPVIAHAERYTKLNDEFYRLVDLQEMECKIQINAYSLEKEKNEFLKDFARLIIRNNFANYIGSDAHRMNHRTPSYKEGLDYLKENVSKDYYNQLVYENAERDFKL